MFCPHCSAPKEYLYDNTGKSNQFECKVCSHIFSTNPNPYKDTIFRCPHCNYELTLFHQRKDFNVYKCCNRKCSYYIDNLNSMNSKDYSKFKKNPSLFKLHYIYRAYNINANTLTKDFRDFLRTPIDISRSYYLWHVIGLCLTYHVNYGMSYRATSSIMFDVHNVKVSRQTIRNWCGAVVSIVHPVLEFYPYDLSNTIAGDETYIKIRGKTNYIFFMFDAIKKIITSYRVFDKRDSLSAIIATYSTLSKYDTLPYDLKLITDGNPIYKVAHQYWLQHGMKFDLHLVIGLTNIDDISKRYRSQKQIVERHNRTFKLYYRPTNGFSSLHDSNTYMILFSVCFNFLRPHSSLDYNVPQHVESIARMPSMPAKWAELMYMGYRYTSLYH